KLFAINLVQIPMIQKYFNDQSRSSQALRQIRSDRGELLQMNMVPFHFIAMLLSIFIVMTIVIYIIIALNNQNYQYPNGNNNNNSNPINNGEHSHRNDLLTKRLFNEDDVVVVDCNQNNNLTNFDSNNNCSNEKENKNTNNNNSPKVNSYQNPFGSIPKSMQLSDEKALETSRAFLFESNGSVVGTNPDRINYPGPSKTYVNDDNDHCFVSRSDSLKNDNAIEKNLTKDFRETISINAVVDDDNDYIEIGACNEFGDNLDYEEHQQLQQNQSSSFSDNENSMKLVNNSINYLNYNEKIKRESFTEFDLNTGGNAKPSSSSTSSSIIDKNYRSNRNDRSVHNQHCDSIRKINQETLKPTIVPKLSTFS
ncbi:hypothetical protein SSS_08853, partial [Sarcoptes scabiei]